jgi:hypothetical protein
VSSISSLTDLEYAAMTALLAGDDPLLARLRDQLAGASVTGREFTGAGFFTSFAPGDTGKQARTPRIVIGDVYGELVELHYPVGFLLFVTEGLIDTLECFIHDDKWVDNPTLKRLYYVRKADGGNPTELLETAERDLGWLRELRGLL